MKELVNVSRIEDRKIIVDTILSDIDEWCEETLSDGHRKHLGASIIGKPCARELWYVFRWAKKEELGKGTKRTAGQILRLFERGKNEEFSMVTYLEGIGCKFEAGVENQIRFSDVGGHFGGSVDNIGTLPERYGIKERILFEFKTSNMAEFNKLKKDGLKNTKPVHWSQICTYGYKFDLKYCLYICVDKNTDELYSELVELDHEHGKAMIESAAMIISSKVAPPKYSMSSTCFVCKWCAFSNVCHNGEPVEKNCRSCVYSTPIENQQWVCELAPPDQNVIPEHVIPIGCNKHKGI
jgi:hypothetical protein